MTKTVFIALCYAVQCMHLPNVSNKRHRIPNG